jgi:pimeloyl-ACP methyl ester carboxylesterase
MTRELGPLGDGFPVVLVHGAFHELQGPNEIKSRWLPALQDGLWHHGVDLDPADVGVVFYGDLFRNDPEVPDSPQMVETRQQVELSLEALGGSDVLGALSQAANNAAFERTVDMVTTMTTTPDLADQIGERYDRVVGPRTKVVVAHSMGTVIAWTALSFRPESAVHTLVTLGSPLGSPMVFDMLDPKPVDGRGAWPGAVQRWVNVAAVGDKAAGGHHLSERFGTRVEDRQVDNGHRAHDPEPYLNAAATGEAVAAALRS